METIIEFAFYNMNSFICLGSSDFKKIARLKNWLINMDRGHIEIEVDGNVSFENAKKMRDAGANIFVAGSSSVFHKEYSLEDAIGKLRVNIGD